MAIVVIFALRHAINSARKDSGAADAWYNMSNYALNVVCDLNYLRILYLSYWNYSRKGF